MKYELSLAESGKYVICRVLEPVTTELALEFGRATAEFSRPYGITRRLFDVRGVRNVSSVTRNYDFAYKDLAGVELEATHRGAILVDPTDRSHDFVQVLMKNAGYDVKIFIDEERAIAWLEQP